PSLIAPTTATFPLSLHDALPISLSHHGGSQVQHAFLQCARRATVCQWRVRAGRLPLDEVFGYGLRGLLGQPNGADCLFELRLRPDRKSTRLNSSHECISYAVFCL